ncbi:ABC transporter permease [Lactococcus garvieae]|uniref:ABC transporter permease n=1 Tax=Lactococcus garvieae TaxID=1363 RepID=UPI0009BD4863|nr:FtsX-like permease family protein [Lactococcus garvieae]
MNFIKRAGLHLISKRGKTLLLGLVFMAILSFVLAGLTIRSAATKAAEEAKKSVGATVTLAVDRQKLAQQGRMMGGDMPSPISRELAEKISHLPGVASTLLSVGGAVTKGQGIEPVKVETGNTMGGEIKANIGGSNMAEVDFRMTGVNATDLAGSFSDGTAKIVEGKGLTEEDLGSNHVLIEQTLAEKNDLKVGDTFELKDTDGKAHKVKITGIYQTTASPDGMAARIPSMNPVNNIFASYTLAETLATEREKDTVDQAIFNLDNPEKMDEFVAAAEKELPTDSPYALQTNDAFYQQMLGPINNVSGFAMNIVVLVALAGSLILGLIVIMSIRERRYEIGVLMSLGERKSKIIGQFFVELLIIMVLAIGGASITGNFIGNAIGNQLLSQQNTAQTQEAEEASSQQNLQQGGMIRQQAGGPGSNSPLTGQAKAEQIEAMDVKMNGTSIVILGLIALAIVILAVLAASVGILQLQPKAVLTGN